MFFIDPTFLKVVVIIAGILVAIFGLTFLTLRRRSEILDHYFTPDEEGLEEDFFRRRAQRQHAAHTQQPQEEPEPESSDVSQADQWDESRFTPPE